MLTYLPADSLFDGHITSLLSVLRILIKVLSRVHAKRKESLHGFTLGTSVGRFPSDGAASMAV